MKGTVIIVLIFFSVLVSTLTTGVEIGEDASKGVVISVPIAPINYTSVNVNNSLWFRGYSPATLPVSTATQSALNLKLDLDGGNANQLVNISPYDFIATYGRFLNLNVTGSLSPLGLFENPASGEIVKIIDGTYGLNVDTSTSGKTSGYFNDATYEFFLADATTNDAGAFLQVIGGGNFISFLPGGGGGIFIDTTSMSGDGINIDSSTEDLILSDGVGNAVKVTLGDINLLGDNFKLLLGAASDAEIYYNATSLIINPKAVGSGLTINLGDLQIGTTGNQEELFIYDRNGTRFSIGQDTTSGFHSGLDFRPLENTIPVGGRIATFSSVFNAERWVIEHSGGVWTQNNWLALGKTSSTLGLRFSKQSLGLNVSDNIYTDFNITAGGILTIGGNATFEEDVIIDGTLYGGSPVKIAGINISNNLFNLRDNLNGSLRFTLTNTNKSSNATSVISTINDVGGAMSVGIGSSNFMIGSTNYKNVTALFSKSRGKTVFANFYNEIFAWLINPQDDNDPNNLVEVMRLDSNGLNLSVFNTGNVLSGDIEATFGQGYGAISIGNVELFLGNLSLSGLDLNGTFVIRNRDGTSNIKFAFVGKNNKVRFAIPKEGVAFALYNPRSEMIGGNLGQAFDDGIINCTAQGYRFIDCATDLTGADLGVQDDIEFWGALYGGNGTWNISDAGNLITEGNITSENSFLPQYIFAHDDAVMILSSANVWANLSFFQEEAEIKKGITHTFNDNTNHTFIINVDGVYEIEYNFDVIDTSVSASDIDVAGRVVFSNGTEILGSVFETDIIKQNIENELTHSLLTKFKKDDVIVFQFTADDVDVEISTHGTFGDHPESASIKIEKVANL